ncbi:uncharacterized protein LOC131148311 [Malania oleifera]|uniref:uncharacterized protein LOC131148311 n=1 Tax=Malania oleifera TaxID=397392 RepID=UPI0025AE6862|nr:uncharacterized protein LOC131148311 [Malania oleifera]
MATLEMITFLASMVMMVIVAAGSSDTNSVFQPCADAKVQKSDGFSFGIAFASRDSFFYNRSIQLSPCDSRLSLSSSNSQLSLFRPKVDEISLLTINTTTSFSPFGQGFSKLSSGLRDLLDGHLCDKGREVFVVRAFES